MAIENLKQIENIVEKLQQINITDKKDILNIKVSSLKELYVEKKLNIKDLVAIWELQEMLQKDNWLETLFKKKT